MLEYRQWRRLVTGLPAAKHSFGTRSDSKPAKRSGAYIKNMKILVIEDEANIAQILRLYLEQAGYTVLTASDGVAGIELHAREHPDLVILDLMLPALDGMEVCRRIRAWANTPILMLTARQGEEDRIAGLELGADDYLVKPFSPREVVSRVKAILRRSHLSATADSRENKNEMEPALVSGGRSVTDTAVQAQGAEHAILQTSTRSG